MTEINIPIVVICTPVEEWFGEKNVHGFGECLIVNVRGNAYQWEKELVLVGSQWSDIHVVECGSDIGIATIFYG